MSDGLQLLNALPLSNAEEFEGFKIVVRLLTNLIEEPSNPKFQSVKSTNPILAKKLLPECFAVLKCAGFRRADDGIHWDCKEPNIALLQNVRSRIMSRLNSYRGPSSSSSVSRSQEIAAAKAEQRIRKQKAQEEELLAIRQRKSQKYQSDADNALARHLSGMADEAAPSSSHAMLKCQNCGNILKYRAATQAHMIMCPCGAALRHMSFNREPLHEDQLPIEAAEVVEGRARQGGPTVVVQMDGESVAMPFYNLLQMMNNAERNQATGASSAAIDALPLRDFANGESLADVPTCQICLEDYAEGDKIRTLPCFHLFHRDCVDVWLKGNKLCPVCRTQIS